MRDSKERLAEIRERADARIAAIKKRNRAVAGACTTFVMCIAIGLSVYRSLSAPPTPPLEPTISTTVSSGADTTTSMTTVSTTAVTTSVLSTDTTVTSAQPSTSETIHVTVTTDAPVSSTVTTVVPTVTTRTITRLTTRRTAISAPTSTTTPAPSSATSQSEETTAHTEPPATTTTLPEHMATHPITTASPTVPTTTTDSYTDGNIQSPSRDESTTTTGDWGLQNATTTTVHPPITTTTQSPTSTPYDSVVVSVSSAQDVSVGDIITVEVNISDYHCVVAGELYIQYDPDVLQLQAELQNEFGNILNGAYSLEVRCPSEGEMQLLFSSSAIEGSAQGGTVLRLSFKVCRGLGDGTTISCEIPAMISNHGQGDYDTPVTVINGTITPADPNYSWWV